MKRKPLIVELVGPPGTGKTSLAETLLKRNSKIRVDIAPYFRRIEHVPFFARNFLWVLPTLLSMYYNGEAGRPTPRDIALMTILKGWHRVLERSVSGNGAIVVLEEGAVCLLAKLYGYGAGPLRSENAREWWNHMYKEWAKTLDVVIRLDAPLTTLLERIRARGVQYEFKEMSDEEAFKYLALIQIAQEHVLSALTAEVRGPKILCFNTVEKSSEQICDEMVALGLLVADALNDRYLASNRSNFSDIAARDHQIIFEQVAEDGGKLIHR